MRMHGGVRKFQDGGENSPFSGRRGSTPAPSAPPPAVTAAPASAPAMVPRSLPRQMGPLMPPAPAAPTPWGSPAPPPPPFLPGQNQGQFQAPQNQVAPLAGTQPPVPPPLGVAGAPYGGGPGASSPPPSMPGMPPGGANNFNPMLAAQAAQMQAAQMQAAQMQPPSPQMQALNQLAAQRAAFPRGVAPAPVQTPGAGPVPGAMMGAPAPPVAPPPTAPPAPPAVAPRTAVGPAGWHPVAPGAALAKGGKFDSAKAAPGNLSTHPGAEKLATGGKVRKFNSASAPAENLPTHPGAKKLAKGGVLHRKPKPKAVKEPVPTPPEEGLDNIPPTPPPAAGPPMLAKGGKWIQKMKMKKGALHKQLGVPEDKKIPEKKLEKAAQAPGKLGRRARVAETLAGLKKAKGGKADCDKMAAGGAAKQRRGFPNTQAPPKKLKFAAGGKIRGCGAATKGCNFSGIY